MFTNKLLMLVVMLILTMVSADGVERLLKAPPRFNIACNLLPNGCGEGRMLNARMRVSL